MKRLNNFEGDNVADINRLRYDDLNNLLRKSKLYL